MKKFWKSTPSEYKDYLFIYLWGGIWAALSFAQPRVIGGNTEGFQVPEWMTYAGQFWAAIAVVGAALAIIGLVRRDNLVLERAGVFLLMVGPLAYSITMLGELVFRAVGAEANPLTSDWRVMTIVVFALWPFLFLNKRRRHLRNRVHLVSKIPLNDEGETK